MPQSSRVMVTWAALALQAASAPCPPRAGTLALAATNASIRQPAKSILEFCDSMMRQYSQCARRESCNLTTDTDNGRPNSIRRLKKTNHEQTLEPLVLRPGRAIRRQRSGRAVVHCAGAGGTGVRTLHRRGCNLTRWQVDRLRERP